jgi:hypothetical protein
MCLNIDTHTRPARVVSRWKHLVRNSNGKLTSPAFDFKWKTGGAVNVAKASQVDPDQTGFHVYLTKRDALRSLKHWITRERVLVKLKVSDFIGAGKIYHCDDYSNGRRGEVWGKAQIVGIYRL